MTQRIVSIHRQSSHQTGSQVGSKEAAHPKRRTQSQRSATTRWAEASATPHIASPVSPRALPTFAPPAMASAVPASPLSPLSPLAPKLAVSIAEAAQLLSISRSHLYPIVMRGEIPSFHIGRSHLIRMSALEAWIRRQEEEAA